MSCSKCGGKGQIVLNGMTITCPGCHGFGHEIPQKPEKKPESKVGLLKTDRFEFAPYNAGEPPRVFFLPRTYENQDKDPRRFHFKNPEDLDPSLVGALTGASPKEPGSKQTRQEAKARNFSILYGGSRKDLEEYFTQRCSCDQEDCEECSRWRQLFDKTLCRRKASDPSFVFSLPEQEEQELEVFALKTRDPDPDQPPVEVDWARMSEVLLKAYEALDADSIRREVFGLEPAKKSTLTPQTIRLKASVGDTFWTVRLKGVNDGFDRYFYSAVRGTIESVEGDVLTKWKYKARIPGTGKGFFYDVVSRPPEFVFGSEEEAEELCDRMNEVLDGDVLDKKPWQVGQEEWIEILGLGDEEVRAALIRRNCS